MNSHLFLIIFLFRLSAVTVTDFFGFSDNFASQDQPLDYCIKIGKIQIKNSQDLEKFIISKYGDIRISEIKGHRHSGIDLKANHDDPVFAISDGKVIDIFREFPHKTVIVQHFTGIDKYIYSVYIHLEDICVSKGELVTSNSCLGRIFNREELKKSNFNTLPHAHLEIRHNIDDHGTATFTSMNLSELNKYCIDPLIFFKRVFKKE